jgi:hypothetical protein
VTGFSTSVCLLPGDSGGSFISGEYAVGVASAGDFTPKSEYGAGYNACSPGGFSIAYPMIATQSGEESVAQSAPAFELAVSVSAPVVSAATANAATGDGTISGHLPRPFATGTPVSLSLDGHQKASTAADPSGAWSFALAGLALGRHSYTLTAGSGHSTATTHGTLTVSPPGLTSIKAPAISGTMRVGSKVTASPGTWSPAAPTFTYQWLANGKQISGATSASYTIPAALAGSKLSATVTARQAGYRTAARTSAAGTVAKGILTATGKPKLLGTPAVGKQLAVTKGTWNPVPAIKIQWYANGRPIPRATGTSLALTTALTGKAISVTVTASKAGYATATVRLTESTKIKS